MKSFQTTIWDCDGAKERESISKEDECASEQQEAAGSREEAGGTLRSHVDTGDGAQQLAPILKHLITLE